MLSHLIYCTKLVGYITKILSEILSLKNKKYQVEFYYWDEYSFKMCLITLLRL